MGKNIDKIEETKRILNTIKGKFLCCIVTNSNECSHHTVSEKINGKK